LRKPNFKGSNDHRGGNDGNNAQVDMNYGTSLGKEKVSSMQLQIQLRGQTGLKMLQVIYLML
jgi:iron complex outermembrane receptor protein